MLAQQYPPPPPPQRQRQQQQPQGNGYHSSSSAAAASHPPPPVANASAAHHQAAVSAPPPPLGEEDSGALTSTINLVASAATSLFSLSGQALGSPQSSPAGAAATNRQRLVLPEEEQDMPDSYLNAAASYFAAPPTAAGASTAAKDGPTSYTNSSSVRTQPPKPPQPQLPPLVPDAHKQAVASSNPRPAATTTTTSTTAAAAANAPTSVVDDNLLMAQLPPSAFTTPVSTPVKAPRSVARSLPRPPVRRTDTAQSNHASSSASKLTAASATPRRTTPGSRFRLPPRRGATPPRRRPSWTADDADTKKAVDTPQRVVTENTSTAAATTTTTAAPSAVAPAAIAAEEASVPVGESSPSIVLPTVDDSLPIVAAATSTTPENNHVDDDDDEPTALFHPPPTTTTAASVTDKDNDMDMVTPSHQDNGREEDDTTNKSNSKEEKEEWLPTMDPQTGQTYYYHVDTGETRWTRPTVAVDDDIDDVRGIVTDYSQSTAAAAVNVSDNTSNNETDDKNIIGNNEHTSGLEVVEPSAPEPVTHEEAVDEDALADGAAMDDVPPYQDTLPEGWQQASDPTTGQVYYYNSTTGESSWEFPTTTVPPPDDEVDLGDPLDAGHAMASWESPEDNHQMSLEVGDDDNANHAMHPVASGEELPDSPDHQQSLPENEEEAPLAGSPPDDAHVAHALLANDEVAAELLADDHNSQEVEEEVLPESLAPPEEQNNDDVPLTPEVATTLPEGWMELHDPSDTPYYYNSTTGETRWDPPPLSTPGEQETDPSESTALEMSESTIPQPEEGPSESSTMRAEDEWVSCTHEETGEVYYYSTITGETSWDPPSSLLDAAEPAVKLTSPNEQAVEEESNASPPKDEMAGIADDPMETVKSGDEHGPVTEHPIDSLRLPSEWTSSIYEETGQVYYINTATGETTWDPPVTDALSAESPSHRMDESPEALAAPLSEGGHPGAQLDDKESFSENECAREGPRQSPELLMEAGEEGDSSEVNSENVLEGAPSGLPPGWVLKEDGTSGKMFYHNVETGKNSWDPPTFGSMPVTEQTLDNSQKDREDIDDAGQCETENHAVEKEEVDSPWEAVDDPSSGLVYYFNSETGETTWDNPFVDSAPTKDPDKTVLEANDAPLLDPGLADGADEFHDDPSLNARVNSEMGYDEYLPELSEVDDQGELPEGWEVVRDANSGDVYYVNAIEGISSWERPTAKDPRLDGEIVSQEEVENEANVRSKTIDADDGLAESSTRDAEDDSLPEHWVKELDPDSGLPYYYNTLTDETTWDKPGQLEFTVNAETPSSSDHTNKNLSDTYPSESAADVGLAEGFQGVSMQSHVKTKSAPAICEPPDGMGTKRIGRRFGASIGFGGKVCFTDGTKIVVRKICHFAPLDVAVKHESRKSSLGIRGALISSAEDAVKEYLSDCAEADPSDLLWGLIEITARSKGRLRSQDRSSEVTSPQAAIVELLKRDDVPFESKQRLLSSSYTPELSGKDNHDENLAAIESLLVEGRKKEAVEEAYRCNQFGLALFIAAMCDREVHFEATKKFANNVFPRGTPFSAAAVLYSDYGEGAVDIHDVFGDNESLPMTWRKHLTALMCNRITDWDKATVALGDRLRDIGEYAAAHCCYMVSGAPMGRATKRSTKWTLAGCSMGPLDVALRTEASLMALFRTEGYEWAKRRANSKALIRSLQPYKLVYSHLLVDLGLDTVAKEYLDEVIPFFEARSRRPPVNNVPSVPLCQWIALGDVEGMKQNAIELAARLKCAETPDDTETIGDLSFVTAYSRFEPTKVEADPVASAHPPRKESLGLPQPARPQHNAQPPTLRTKAELPPAAPPAPPMAHPHNSRSQDMDESKTVQDQTPAAVEPPYSATKKEAPRAVQHRANSPSSPSKVAPSPASAPANLEQKSSTPSSSPKKGMMGMVKGLFGIKEDNAVQADLGGKMEAYYDKEKKRWIFPGDDPNAEDPMAGPPPTTAELNMEPKEEEKVPQDPLSAMMAPPSRAPRSALPGRRSGITPLTSNTSPAMPAAAPPKFAVFTPKPTD